MDATKPLVIWMSNDAEYKRIINSNETIYRIIDNFPGKRHAVEFLLKLV
jgi:hypothetical protein